MTADEIFQAWATNEMKMEDLNQRYTELLLRVYALQGLLEQRGALTADQVESRMDQLRAIVERDTEKPLTDDLDQPHEDALADKLDEIQFDAQEQ